MAARSQASSFACVVTQRGAAAWHGRRELWHGCSVSRCRIPNRAAPPGIRPVEPGEVWNNPVTLERGVVVELPWLNDQGRAVADLTALPGARVAGEHMHPALLESFSVQEGELTVMRDGRKSVLRAGERAEVEPASGTTGGTRADVEAVVRVEITPGERFVHMIETLYGLAREGHVNKRGMPHPLQLALFAVEFSDALGWANDRRPSRRCSCSACSRRSLAARATAPPTRRCRERRSPCARPTRLGQAERLGCRAGPTGYRAGDRLPPNLPWCARRRAPARSSATV